MIRSEKAVLLTGGLLHLLVLLDVVLLREEAEGYHLALLKRAHGALEERCLEEQLGEEVAERPHDFLSLHGDEL